MINGKLKGQTPLTLDHVIIPESGEIQIQIKLGGYTPYLKTIRPNQTLEMKTKKGPERIFAELKRAK